MLVAAYHISVYAPQIRLRSTNLNLYLMKRGSGCTFPVICMVEVLGCEKSDGVHMEKWGVSSRSGGRTPVPPTIRALYISVRSFVNGHNERLICRI